MSKIIVRSRHMATQFKSQKPWAAISISTHATEFADLDAENRKGLLQLSFLDVSMSGDSFKDRVFSEVQAKSILEFVEQVWPEIEVLLVHCEAGMSRSPAIAAALDYKFNTQEKAADWFMDYIPNPLVFSTMLENIFGKDSPEVNAGKQMVIEKIYDEPFDPCE